MQRKRDAMHRDLHFQVKAVVKKEDRENKEKKRSSKREQGSVCGRPPWKVAIMKKKKTEDDKEWYKKMDWWKELKTSLDEKAKIVAEKDGQG